MPFPDHFSRELLKQNLARLDNLRVETQPQWGKMDAAQMLAHLNVAYDLAYGRKQDKPGPIKKWLLTRFLKPIVTGDKPYKPNSRTAPVFVVADKRDFDKEKADLIANLEDTVANGRDYFEGKESSSFGAMTAHEWSQMLQKHLEHHFKQFDV